MLIIGLTGGVASGKSFVASQFRKLKIPVFDADLEVHKLLASDQEIFLQVQQNFPNAVVNGKIDRKILGDEVLGNKQKLQNLEKIIYPKLRKKENLFIKNCRSRNQKIVVLNVPLLFEKGDQKNSSYKKCDKTITTIVSPSIQFYRFKSRFKSLEDNKDLVQQKFKNITNRQINNSHRKNQADFIIYTGLNKGFTVKQVKNLLFSRINVNKPRSKLSVTK
jgi:dephospho-CoA kinase